MIYDLAFFSCVNGALYFFLDILTSVFVDTFPTYLVFTSYLFDRTGDHLSYYSPWKCFFLFCFFESTATAGKKGLVLKVWVHTVQVYTRASRLAWAYKRAKQNIMRDERCSSVMILLPVGHCLDLSALDLDLDLDLLCVVCAVCFDLRV